MILPVFTILVFLAVFINIGSGRASRRYEEKKRAFYEREREANNTRKKSLDGLKYIHIPENIPPEITKALSGEARDAAERIEHLRVSSAKIVNLTGYTNTDLKLEYGAANITELIRYDTDYMSLITALHTCGKALYEAGKYTDAQAVLEFAAQTGSDIRDTYRLLIDMYKTKLFMDKETSLSRIKALLPIAEDLKSLSKEAIVGMINEAAGTMP